MTNFGLFDRLAHCAAVENPAEFKSEFNSELEQPSPSSGQQVHDSFISDKTR
jgi:hypothetical protein